jgi:hypothetical protein
MSFLVASIIGIVIMVGWAAVFFFLLVKGIRYYYIFKEMYDEHKEAKRALDPRPRPRKKKKEKRTE